MAKKGKTEAASAPQPTPEEVVALALNEQGYLFQHKITTVLLAREKSQRLQHHWQLEAPEVPVSLPNGSETRIDLLLRHGPEEGVPWRAVIECKRAARDYKRWVFFGESEYTHGPSAKFYYAEHADLVEGWDRINDPNVKHRVEPCPASPECPVFDYGVEARLNRHGGDKRVSATEAIEDSFQQVILGQAGLGLRLRNSRVLNFRLLPVVVTSAELMSAHFDEKHVSLDRGMIDSKNLKLEPRRWLAVNYRISHVVSLFFPMNLHRNIPLASDIASRQVRTVFVVQAEHIEPFLVWLDKTFPCVQP